MKGSSLFPIPHYSHFVEQKNSGAEETLRVNHGQAPPTAVTRTATEEDGVMKKERIKE